MIKEDIKQITDVKELQRLYIELNDEFEKQEKEIEKIFTKRGFTNIKQMRTMFDYYKLEVDRLNNVIDKIYNEVLNTTEEMYKTLVKIDGRGYYSASLTRLDYLLDKIRKLKGE